MFWVKSVCFLLFCMGTVAAVGVLFGHEDDNANFITNGGFEQGSSGWSERKATVSYVKRARKHGVRGAYIKNRESPSGGVYQKVSFNATMQDQTYYLSCFIKFRNNATEGYIRTKLLYKIFNKDGTTTQLGVAKLPYQTADNEWNQFGGDMDTVGKDVDYMTIWPHVEPNNIDYYLDSCAMTTIEDLGNGWKSTLRSRAKAARRREATIKLNIPQNIQPSDVEVKVRFESHTFRWGVAINKDSLYSEDGTISKRVEFQNYFKEHFNFATFTAAMKWPAQEPSQGQYSYQVDNSVDWLVDNDYYIRGHSLFWEIKDKNPAWVQALTGNAMKNAMMSRVDNACGHYKGKKLEWDMINENLHNHFYEDAIGQKDVGLYVELMRRARAVDPDAEYCINDYEVTRSGMYTSAQRNLALALAQRGQKPDCIGAQSHMRNNEFDVNRFVKRLQILAEPGIAITLGELSIHATTDAERATFLEQSIYAAYSVPEVTGITVWGLGCDLSFANDSNLMEGDDFDNCVANEAGVKLEKLIRTNIFRSQATYTPTSRSQTKTVELWQGRYQIRVYVNGVVMKKEDVTLDPSQNNQWTVDL